MEEPILKKKNLLNRIISNQLTVTTLTTFLMIFVIVGSSYAIFSRNNVNETNDVVVSVGNLQAVVSSSSESIIADYTTLGVSDEVGLAGSSYNFTVSNTGTNEIVYYEVRIIDKEYSVSTIPHKALKFAISKDAGVYSGVQNLGDNRSYIYAGGPLSVGESHNFSLKIWVTEEFGEIARGKSLNASLEITLYSEMPTRNYIIYDLNGVDGFVPKTSVSTGKVTSIVPTHDERTFLGWNEDREATEPEYLSGGVYNKDKGTILYAVWGAPYLYDVVENTLSNYLLSDDGDARILSGGGGYNDGYITTDPDFKNYVWYSGKLWRIVALNNDGSIKLVTDEKITTIYWGEDTTYEGSWVYQWLNEDFKDTLYNYEKLLVTDYKWNATKVRDGDKPDETTMIESPVGLLNYYEYAKSYEKVSLKTGYLNKGYYWWTISAYNVSGVWSVNHSTSIQSAYPSSYQYGVRPSINLKSNIQIREGDGSQSNPYKILGDIEASTQLNQRVSGEYLKFDDELYRIVSIEDNITKITMVDCLKDESNSFVSKYLASSTTFGKSTNTKNDNYLDYYLNNTWYNNIDTKYQQMIVKGIWYLGSVSSTYGSYKSAICETGNTIELTKTCQRTTNIYEGYVGLGRIGEMFTSQMIGGYWSVLPMWTLTPESDSNILILDQYGATLYSSPDYSTNRVRPSINLKSNIQIVSGEGTKESPFEIN